MQDITKEYEYLLMFLKKLPIPQKIKRLNGRLKLRISNMKLSLAFSATASREAKVKDGKPP